MEARPRGPPAVYICPVPTPSPFSVYFPSIDDGFGGWESFFFFSSASGGGKTKGAAGC
jgi:hypothetical protein